MSQKFCDQTYCELHAVKIIMCGFRKISAAHCTTGALPQVIGAKASEYIG